MKYLLDTNIIILALSGVGQTLRERMALADDEDIVTSAIAYAEVALGTSRGKPPPPQALGIFARRVPILSFDLKAAHAYAGLPFKRAGFDRLIAAHALSCDLVVVTDNVGDFLDVPGLTVENWTAG